MKEIPIYVDTSVFGGICDEEFHNPSQAFFDQSREGYFQIVISAVVLAEIGFAPKNVQDFFESVLPELTVVDITEEALLLRDAYIGAKILTPKYADDALHVSMTSVSDCSIIVSWNFKHIVHFDKIPLYNAINVLKGYDQILIYSPLEVIEYED